MLVGMYLGYTTDLGMTNVQVGYFHADSSKPATLIEALTKIFRYIQVTAFMADNRT